ncbi:L-threonylcarbamoyladenylate synthase [Calditrichota bacterium]
MKKQLLELDPGSLTNAVRILVSGGLLIAAADTVYGLIGRAFNKTAFQHLSEIKPERDQPLPVVFDSMSMLQEYFPQLDAKQLDFMQEFVPGATTFVLPFSRFIPIGFKYEIMDVAVRIPKDSALMRLCQACKFPLWATSANLTGETAPTSVEEIAIEVIEITELIIDSGRIDHGKASTAVDLRQEPFRILREGALANQIQGYINNMTDSYKVLTVCTGNICRSPIAGIYLQHLLGDTSEFHVASAGTHAFNGNTATSDMIDIGAEWGVDVSVHRAQQLTHELLDTYDLILVAEYSHWQYIENVRPDIIKKVHLMSEPVDEDGIPDPYGDTHEFYQNTANKIKQSMEGWAAKIKASRSS